MTLRKAGRSPAHLAGRKKPEQPNKFKSWRSLKLLRMGPLIVGELENVFQTKLLMCALHGLPWIN